MPLDLAFPAVACRIFDEFELALTAGAQAGAYSVVVTNLAHVR